VVESLRGQTVTAVSAGGCHSLAVLQNGKILGWGLGLRVNEPQFPLLANPQQVSALDVIHRANISGVSPIGSNDS
jgi:hypothetical protein